MKFAIALVAGLASAVQVKENDGSEIDVTLIDDGTFEVDDYWNEDEDDWTDDWNMDDYCYDWIWEECS